MRVIRRVTGYASMRRCMRRWHALGGEKGIEHIAVLCRAVWLTDLAEPWRCVAVVAMFRALPAITGNQIALRDAIGALLRAELRMEWIQIPDFHAPAALAVERVRDNERIRAGLGAREGGPGGGGNRILWLGSRIQPMTRRPSEWSADWALVAHFVILLEAQPRRLMFLQVLHRDLC